MRGRQGRGKVQRASGRVRLWSETQSETGNRWKERDKSMVKRSTEPFRECGFVRPKQTVTEDQARVLWCFVLNPNRLP